MSEKFYVCSSKEHPQIAKNLEVLESTKQKKDELYESVKEQLKELDEKRRKEWKEIESELEEKGLLHETSKYKISYNTHGQIFAEELSTDGSPLDFFKGLLND